MVKFLVSPDLNALPKYEGEKFLKNSLEKVNDSILSEEALQININDEPFTVIMRTPFQENDMVRGLLFCEDIYTKKEPLSITKVKKNHLGYIVKVNVEINSSNLSKGYLGSRSLLSVSSCGICGKRELGDLTVSGDPLLGFDFPIKQISMMQASMVENQRFFKLTGGSHAAAAFDTAGQLLILREDVGRHNAVDKVVGGMLNSSIDSAKFLLVSGRVSYEIITKVFRAKIPVLIAVSAPSSLAIDYAKELGIRLYAFCRDGKSTRYS